MKLFKTSNIRIVQLCQMFHFDLPSVQLARRQKVFFERFCVSLLLLFFFSSLFLPSIISMANKDLHSPCEFLHHICIAEICRPSLLAVLLRAFTSKQTTGFRRRGILYFRV